MYKRQEMSVVEEICSHVAIIDKSHIAEQGSVEEISVSYTHLGFGYDPLFIVEETGKSYAQMAPEEKNAVSHQMCIRDSLQRCHEHRRHGPRGGATAAG